MPALGPFAQGVADGFASTLLPETPVYGFAARAIVPGEIAVGALLILGLFTRWAPAGGALLMTALVFRTALRQQWGPLSTQRIYAAVYYGLHLFVGDNPELPLRPHAVGGRGRERVFRPVVLRVAALEVLFDLEVGVVPEVA